MNWKEFIEPSIITGAGVKDLSASALFNRSNGKNNIQYAATTTPFNVGYTVQDVIKLLEYNGISPKNARIMINDLINAPLFLLNTQTGPNGEDIQLDSNGQWEDLGKDCDD